MKFLNFGENAKNENFEFWENEKNVKRKII